MKKNIFFLLPCLILACFFLMIPAQAIDVSAETEQYLEDSRWDTLKDAVPEQSRQDMEKSGISGIGDAASLRVSDLISVIRSNVKDAALRPARILCSLVGIILVCTVMKSIGSSLGQNDLHRVFLVITSAFVSAILLEPIIGCILEIDTVIREFSLFLATYIPAFAGVMTSAGQPMTAAAYNVLIFGTCQVVGQLLKSFFVPLISCYLSLVIVSEICPGMGMGQLAAGIKSFITWALGLSITIFLGLLALQTAVASGGDSVSAKTAKFFISSAVPGVGSMLSDLFMATQGCVQLLKSTVGVFGIAAAVFTFLPSLIKVTLWYIATQLAGLCGAILGAEEISRLLRSIASALGVMLAILLYYAMLFIISTSLMIIAFRGG